MAQYRLIRGRCPNRNAASEVTGKCYPTDQLMHRVMDWFVRQPLTRGATPAPLPLQAYSNSGSNATSRGCIRAPAVVAADDRIRRRAGSELAMASATSRSRGSPAPGDPFATKGIAGSAPTGAMPMATRRSREPADPGRVQCHNNEIVSSRWDTAAPPTAPLPADQAVAKRLEEDGDRARGISTPSSDRPLVEL